MSVPRRTIYYAHSANDHKVWHELKTHLLSVGMLARTFSSARNWAAEAELAGHLHDLGKYADRFQARLKGQDSGLDHWSQGASIALIEHRAVAAALAIEGHHIGLQQGSKNSLNRLLPATLANAVRPGLQLSEANIPLLQSRAALDQVRMTTPDVVTLTSWSHTISAMLDIRLLFSCLVDADFLDTESHFNGDGVKKVARFAAPKLDLDAALNALDRFMRAQIRGATQSDTNVLGVRESLWDAVGQASSAAPGLFTLTAPTGSGKTLAMLRFALEHARRNKLKRVIVAVPYLSVIEQKARIYRRIFADFPDHFVLEHHSLAGLGQEFTNRDAEGSQERQRRLLSENWDTPIVLTTNVQLLESLFSNKPSACRKLHNLMESVILFDEAQSLPQDLAVPTLAALSHLSAASRTSVVFATATQPAFDSLHMAVSRLAVNGWKPLEIVPSHRELFKLLKRVNVVWPQSGEKRSWADLAFELKGVEQVLVVVNLKRHALGLLEVLGDLPDVLHLSTNLCAEHRRSVLEDVRHRLNSGQPCRLISTQCVEAGVDLDFPKVYRAFAPLDAIAQAAGRCNREGRMSALGQFGEVIVFEPKEDSEGRGGYPTFAYYQAAETTRTLLLINGQLDINDPQIFQDYYRRLYNLTDPASQNVKLSDSIAALDFAEVAREYRLIKQDAIQILVPWVDRVEEFRALYDEAGQMGITGSWVRRAQGLAVSVYRPQDGLPAWAIPAKLRRYGSSPRGVSDEWFILEGDFYDDALGLKPPDGPQIFIA